MHSRPKIQSFIMVIMLLVSGLVTAATIPDLYDVEIPVQSQDRLERLRAIKQGLAEVLVRVSGRNDVVLSLPSLVNPANKASGVNKKDDKSLPDLALVGSTPGITSALDTASRYARLYRYQKPTGRPHMVWSVDWASRNNTDKSSDKSESEQVLWLRFDEKKVNQLLQSNGLPVWGKTRPSILVWLAYDQGGKRVLLANNSANSVHDELINQSRLYGLPLRLPLMDLADHANIQIGDVWGNFEDTILRASKRYHTEAVVVGRVSRLGNQWVARWTLYHAGRRLDWETTKPVLTDAMALGVSQTSQTLAQAFAHVAVGDNAQNVVVQIKDIVDLVTYARITDYLKNLSGVKSIATKELTSNSVFYTITTRGGRIALMQAIALGQKLSAEPNTFITLPDTQPGTVSGQQTDTQSATKLSTSGQSEAQNILHTTQPDLVYRILK